MEPLRHCVLLVLVLLEVSHSAEDGECGSERTNCEVTEVYGTVVSVECGNEPYRQNDQIKRSTRDTYQENGKRNRTSSDIYRVTDLTNRTLTGIIQENYPTNRTSGEQLWDNYRSNETSSEHFHEIDPTNITVNSISLANNETNGRTKDIYEEKYQYNGKFRNIYWEIIRSNRTTSDQWPNITTVQVTLLGNISLLDLSSFPNLRTVILKTSGNISLKTCGVENVTTWSTTSSKLEEVSFIKHLSNLKHLNLSDNMIKAIPIAELPSSVITLDLSYNNVVFDTITSLPDTIQVLNVSNNNITNVDGIILKGNVVILDITVNMLTHVPVFDMNALEELYLSRNKISTLQEGVFLNLTSLTILDLRENCLSVLEGNVFQGLHRLQWLDMSENNVMFLAPATFQYLNNLVTLSLSGNANLGNLQDIEDASFLFGTGQRLQIIDASRTNLTRIPSTLSRSVRKLLLGDNAIESLQCGELDSFPLLQVMDISENLISDIEEDALGRLDFLSHLLLSGNKLTSVPKSLPDQLQVFDLRCNTIEKLNIYDFLGLQKLRVLLLSRNKITVVEDGAFGQLSSLEVLDLSHNPIKSLSRTSFIGPRKLKEMYLVSLTELISLQEPLSFPAPESAHLEVLNMESSPVLATQLMDDVAALTMFHELFELNLNHCRLSTLRSDLPKYLPRLHKLELTGNVLNCTNIIWLVKWLQALNISMQNTGKFRQEFYSLKHVCCEEVNDAASLHNYDEATVICASPEYLAGKQITSLKEEDFPDVKLTSSTLLPDRQVFITEAYLSQTFADLIPNTSSRVSDMMDFSSKNSLSINNFSYTTLKELPSIQSTTSLYQTEDLKPTLHETKLEPVKNKTLNNAFVLEKTPIKPQKLTKAVKSISRSAQKWKYLKSETKYKLPLSDLVIVLLNDSRSTIKNIGNQLINESISSGAYSAHELPPTSHPGMVVFLLVVAVLLVASSAMVYSHCSQNRRGREYQHHQDIEVTSFGGNDLW